jgi:geranylgeranyl diphosphate synthase type 3
VYNLLCRFDDILDNSTLRGGIPAAHKVYGVPGTVGAAMCVYFMSLQRLVTTNKPELIKLFTEMIVEFWRGQAMEIYWRDNHICPSEEEYLEMLKRSKDRVRAMSRI